MNYPAHPAVSQACPSCGVESAGRYCPECGEKFLSDADYHFGHFLTHHLPHEVMHWDGKLARTLRELIFAPGKMAAEFARGRRQPYLNPLRLYLVVFLAQAFLSGFGVHHLSLTERVDRFDLTGLVRRLAGEQLRSKSEHLGSALYEETIAHWLSEGGTLLIVFFVALVLMGIMVKYRRRYLEHLTLALNIITFTLMVMLIGDVITLTLGRGTVSELAESYRINAAAYLLPFYSFFAIRRFYGTSWGGSVGYAVTLTAASVVFAQILNVLVLLLQISVA